MLRTLASRLTEAGARVLVLEAGGWDRSPLIQLPLAWGKLLQDRRYDWGYETEPQPTLTGRRIECARGKVVGGSSSINAMAYVRGNRGDYDRWAAGGLPGWSYADVLPYFRRQETWPMKRQGGGHIAIVVGRDQHRNLMCLGGNQSDAVNIKPFPAARPVSFRWPKEVSPPARTGFDTLPLVASDGRVSVREG